MAQNRPSEKRRAYSRAYNRPYYQRVRCRRHLQALYCAFDYKGGARCVDCGFSNNLDGLEFDHVSERGPKEANVGSLLWHPWSAAIEAELDKCDVVCGTCHNLRTGQRHDQRLGVIDG